MHGFEAMKRKVNPEGASRRLLSLEEDLRSTREGISSLCDGRVLLDIDP